MTAREWAKRASDRELRNVSQHGPRHLQRAARLELGSRSMLAAALDYCAALVVSAADDSYNDKDNGNG